MQLLRCSGVLGFLDKWNYGIFQNNIYFTPLTFFCLDLFFIFYIFLPCIWNGIFFFPFYISQIIIKELIKHQPIK